jgi:murein tripeptide amidase MpaA
MSKISNLVIDAQEAAPYMEKEYFLKVFGEDAIWIFENVNGINEEIEEYMKTEQYREEHDEQERMRADALYDAEKERRAGFFNNIYV